MRDERNSGRASCEVKIRLDSKPTFKKQGHEKQFLFNELVWEQFDVIDSALKQTLPTVEKACAAIQKGERLIDIRQKNIKIADRSEHGWTTVAEYEEDELADNSDDEKRLFRAEARAGRKKQRSLKDSNKKKGASRKHFLECRGQILCHMAVSPLRLLVVPSLARAFSGCWHNCRCLSRVLHQAVLIRSLGRVSYMYMYVESWAITESPAPCCRHLLYTCTSHKATQ